LTKIFDPEQAATDGKSVTAKARSTLDPESYSIVKDRSHTSLCRAGGSRGTLREIMVELIGIEPTTSGLQSPRSPS
jgi:hypothetical protein